MAKHNETGKIGEDIATKWLIQSSFEIVERNFNKKWGEIDIVARLPDRQAGETDGCIHFVEVKSVSYETKQALEYAVSHETWRPEENVHKNKQERVSRAIQSWVLENNYEGEWQFDIIAVRMVSREKYATVKHLPNIVFG